MAHNAELPIHSRKNSFLYKDYYFHIYTVKCLTLMATITLELRHEAGPELNNS